ncbi:MAG: methyltransferase domain-containing protein [Planctomycetes bacterium]|nr:methyltransferase domain-containing protein [Planctomycetota bacterium]
MNRISLSLGLSLLLGCSGAPETSSAESMPVLDGEASVKPGINERFLAEDLDVDAFVKRFELESREVFERRDEILDACRLDPGERVADVGAGTGLFTRMFAKAVGPEGQVFAVEIAPKFLDHIQRSAARLKLRNISGVLCAENDVKLAPESVDLAFVCDTYHHFEYPKATLASIRRALRPGGRLVVVDFERIPGVSTEWVLGHVRAGKAVVREEIEAAGFRCLAEPDVGLKENYLLEFGLR